VRRLELGASVAEVARACEVNPNVLHRWERELRGYGAKAFTGNGKMRAEESRVAELERKVGRQAMEVDFFAAMLAACRGAAKTAGINYPRLVTLSDSGQTHPGKRKMKAVPIQPVMRAATPGTW